MQIEKEIYNFVEFEIDKYSEYLKLLEKETEFFPKDKKSAKSIFACEFIVNAINDFLKSATTIEKEFFELYFIRKEKNRYELSEKMFMSDGSFFRVKKNIIIKVAKNLGLI